MIADPRASRCLRFAFVLSILGLPLAAQQSAPQRRLPSAASWTAHEILQNPTGIWYARVARMFDQYGPPDVLGTDDAGNLLVLSVYSGTWTARTVNPDGQWLALAEPARVDPSQQRAELFLAGRAGNLHRAWVRQSSRGRWSLDSEELGHAVGEEFHAVIAADLDPSRPGDEVLAFGITGAVYAWSPQAGDRPATFERVATVDGRVRDAIRCEAPARVLGVSRAGDLLEMRLRGGVLDVRKLASEPMGLGRIARRSNDVAANEVIYVTRDDGVVLRFARQADDSWRREVVFVGAQGLRGIVAGRFYDDPQIESIAVYGYGKQVQLVSRRQDQPWQVETVFAGDDKGHWLAVGELDGRNSTDEIVATGFAGQVVLLSRVPGYGLDAGIAIDDQLEELKPLEADDGDLAPSDDDAGARVAGDGSEQRPWRIAARGGAEAVRELSPLRYDGGFVTKSLLYETLVRRADDGRIVPGLASAWQLDESGRQFTFTLRDGATFHDGSAVTADAVALHFRRWVGLPEHDWLRSNQRIERVEALDPRTLRITLDRPHALLPDLCAINPTAIRAPAALDHEGRQRRAIGSGSFELVTIAADARRLLYREHAAPTDRERRFVELRLFDPGVDPLDALLRGELDAILGTHLTDVDPARAKMLCADPRVTVHAAPGSAMTHLTFRLDDPNAPTADVRLRRAIDAAIDRAELIAVAEHGFAEPSHGFASPSLTIFPQGSRTSVPRPADLVVPSRPLRLLDAQGGALAAALAAQLQRAGIPVELVDASGRRENRDWDLRIDRTHGSPYDPYTTLVSRFGTPPQGVTASRQRATTFDRELTALVDRATATPREADRIELYAQIQRRLDATVAIVPLYAPHRISVLRAGLEHEPQQGGDLYRITEALPARR